MLGLDLKLCIDLRFWSEFWSEFRSCNGDFEVIISVSCVRGIDW